MHDGEVQVHLPDYPGRTTAADSGTQVLVVGWESYPLPDYNRNLGMMFGGLDQPGGTGLEIRSRMGTSIVCPYIS